MFFYLADLRIEPAHTFDFFLEALARMTLQLRGTTEVNSPSKESEHEAGGRDDEEWAAAFELLSRNHTRGPQVQFHRAGGDAAQRQTDQLA